MLDTALLVNEDIAQRFRMAEKHGREETMLIERPMAPPTPGTPVFGHAVPSYPSTATSVTAASVATARDGARPLHSERARQDAYAVARARDSRLDLLARKYEGVASNEDTARLHILTQRLRKLSPRVDAVALSNLETAVHDIERVAGALEDLNRELDEL